MTPKDPDKIAEQESDYDKWFREEVEAALREADDPNTEWIPHEIVKEEMARERARIDALVEEQRKRRK